MPTQIINGKEIANSIKKQLTTQISFLKKKYKIEPTVTTIKIGHDPSSELYLKLRNKACKEVGITTTEINFETSITQNKVIKTLTDLNHDIEIHGILIQYPVPHHIDPIKLMNTISPHKDIEGLHPHNLGQTLLGNEHLVPCTPLAVIKILEHEAIDLKGKNVTIINHSNVVGKPLAIMCLNRNATVNVCHIFTKDIAPFTKKADILISATGIPNLITKDHIKKNSVIIDVGITATKDGIKGDVNRTSVENKAAKLTPVPGGVGPVTIASSIINMVQILKQSTKKQ